MWWASGAKWGSPGRVASSERCARLGGALRAAGLRLVGLRFWRVAAISDFEASTAMGQTRILARQPCKAKPCGAPLRPLPCCTMADFERPPRVLVVEDDDAIAQVLMRSLRMEGYEVRVAAGRYDRARAGPRLSP